MPLVLSGYALNKVCRALCLSGKFETGEGTCALLCLGQLGDARKDCAHATRVHGKLGRSILEALSGHVSACHPERESACQEPYHFDDGVPYCDTCGVFRQSKARL